MARTLRSLPLIVSLAASLGLCFAQTGPTVGTSVNNAPAASAILDYWTPDRLQSALPPPEEEIAAPGFVSPPAGPVEPAVEVPSWAPSTPAASSAAPEIGVATAAPPPEAFENQYPYPFTRFNDYRHLYASNQIPPVFPYKAVGKIFFTLNGSNFVCSGSVIRPHLVLTARHCIFNYINPSGGSFATNVVFYPGWYHGGNGLLHNGWAARKLATWVSNAPGHQYDIGFIQTFDDDGVGCGGSQGGHPIEFYTGYLGYQVGGDSHKSHLDMFGYPAAAPFTGQVMVESQGSPGADNPFGNINTYSAGNDMTGNVNLAYGLNSFRFLARPLELVSPKFLSTNFTPLLNGAIGLPCP